jgi:hypothetical protein
MLDNIVYELTGATSLDVLIFKFANKPVRTIGGNRAKVFTFNGDTMKIVFLHKGNKYYTVDIVAHKLGDPLTIQNMGVIHLHSDPNYICEDDIIFTDGVPYINRRTGFDINVVRELALRSRWLMTRDGHLAKIVSVKNVPILQVYGRPNGYLEEIIDQVNIDLNTLKINPSDIFPHNYDVVGLAHKTMMYNRKEIV